MTGAAERVVGEFDFTSFAAVDPDRARRIAEAEDGDADAPSNVRTIFSSGFQKEGPELIYEVRGNGFLHHMVRNLVGTLVEIGRGAESPEWMAELIEGRDRTRSGPTAPPQGLVLVRVMYPWSPATDGSDRTNRRVG